MTQVGQRRANLVNDPAIYRERHVPNPPEKHIPSFQVGVGDARIALGNDDLI